MSTHKSVKDGKLEVDFSALLLATDYLQTAPQCYVFGLAPRQGFCDWRLAHVETNAIVGNAALQETAVSAKRNADNRGLGVLVDILQAFGHRLLNQGFYCRWQRRFQCI